MRTVVGFKNKELVIELPELENVTINEESISFKSLKADISTLKNELNMNRDNNLDSEKAKTLEKAETKLTLQKFYGSYWTRRNQAACAVVIEALRWKEMECAALRQSSVSFFIADHKSETIVSKWQRALIRAAKVGKGLSKDEKAQKLVLIHWLEAIDPLHRYGGNLHRYYDVWLESESNQPFFYWLDVGDGKDVNLEKCSRADLQLQCIKYLGPKEREAYEVVMEKGRLVYKQSRVFVDTPKGSLWIFVLGTSGDFYVGEKKKGFFQHSSFLAGGTTKASGRLVAHNGILEAIWPLSGHYRPTEEHFKEFCSFLEDHQIDLTNVKKFANDEDTPPKVIQKVEPVKSGESAAVTPESIDEAKKHASEKEEESMKIKVELMKKPPLLQKWSKVAGPTQLQFHAIEQVLSLSPRRSVKPARPFVLSCGLVASPRPSSKIQFSPSTLECLGLGLPNPIHLSNLSINQT